MNKLIEANPETTHPVIDKVFDFTEVKAAFKYFEAQAHVGKIYVLARTGLEGLPCPASDSIIASTDVLVSMRLKFGRAEIRAFGPLMASPGSVNHAAELVKDHISVLLSSLVGSGLDTPKSLVQAERVIGINSQLGTLADRLAERDSQGSFRREPAQPRCSALYGLAHKINNG
ncbi:hypothetical protein B0H17DRAFT_1267933 [Mycena rosella]|uniref:Uncharacterized protein n=1 Tax=Mycena rosella TaxID=1033263 RepID=A0AAD7CNA1_MYCRO|nr:hypothetical protein B0H17DRAFT_1267933 [Mycena rosella]